MKKVLSVIAMVLTAVIVFSSVIFTSVSAYEKGDVNRDNSVDSRDVLHLSKYLVNTGASVSTAYGDLNSDNVIDAKDLLLLRALIAGVTINPKPTTKSDSSSVTSPVVTNPNLPVGVDGTYNDKLARNLVINGCGYNTIAVNQIGYSANGIKKIRLVEGKENAPATANSRISQRVVYLVNTATNTAVANFTSKRRSEYTKKLYGTDAVYTSEVDISSFTTPGKYRLYAPAGYSVEFEISQNPYNKAIDDLTMAMYYQRCGGELTESVLQKYDDYLTANYGATAGKYFNTYKYHARNACHLEATYKNAGKEVVVVDEFDETTGSFVGNTDDSGNVIQLPATDFAYGLHDAGDYGRYTQPAAQTVCDMLAAYELAPDAFKLDVVQDTNGKGEKDNLPDILDHARWEAKFLLNMQAKTGNAAGGFYFKICTKEFASAQGAKPNGDSCFNGSRGVSPTAENYTGLRVQHVNFADTAYAVTALAYCYSVFKDKDPDFANQCLTAAEKGYDFYVNGKVKKTLGMSAAEINARDLAAATDSINLSPWNTGGGAYGGNGSEAANCMWGAVGTLYRATGDSKYLEYVTTDNSVVSKYATDMGTHTGAGYGTLALILADKEGKNVPADVVTTCKDKFASAANSANKRSSASTFFNIENYGWGSNPRMANDIKGNTIAYSLGISTNDDALKAPRLNLSYMLGVNPENWCFITGETEYSSKNIHHYPSILLKRQYSATACVPGLLAGGYTTESGDGSFRYYDNETDYVCNEVCVYWNSAVLLAFAGIVDQDIA